MRRPLAVTDFAPSCVTVSRRRALQLSALVICLLTFGCGQQPRYAKSETTNATPQSSAQLPRTNLPMPPVASSHDAGAQAGGWTLLDGRRESLSDYRGRVLVLDLYATYCVPCRDEIPQLIALQQRYEKQGLKVVGLNVGGAADRRKVPGYVEELGILYDLGNPDGELIDNLSGGETAIPRTYVFDRQGRLVDFSVGYDQEIAARLEQAIQKAVTGDGS